MKKRTKSELEILDAISGKKRLKKSAKGKDLKRHIIAILKLRAEGIIEKDENNFLRLVAQTGIELPKQSSITRRWMTPVWRRYAGKKIVEFVAYGDSREASMRAADILLHHMKNGVL